VPAAVTFLRFTDRTDAEAFQAETSAALGYPLADGITVRYDDLVLDYATGHWIHRFDDTMIGAGVLIPKTAAVIADETTIQRAPTPLQAALLEMGQTKEEAVATVAADATLVTLTAQSLAAQLAPEIIP
jgi:hypothetical protein